jgi:L-iditol 2-dehydrogenase
MKQHVSVLGTDLTIHFQEREIPEPGPGQVRVRIRSVGVCGSDIHYFEHGRIGSFVVESPLILGHESSGIVDAVGPGVETLTPGTRVALEPGIPCSQCHECRAGRYNLCPEVAFFATPPIDGAFAEFVITDANFAHPIPDHVSDNAAALMEPLSVGIWACQKGGVTVGSQVLITGSGPIGIIAALVARARGAGRILLSDTNHGRLEHAQRMGFETCDPSDGELADRIEADVLLECSGAQAAIQSGIAAVRRAGSVILVGMSPTSLVSVPLDVIQGRELWVTGTFRYANTYPTAVQLVSSGAIDLDQLVSQTFGLAQVQEALSYHHVDANALKVMVRVSGE